MARPSVIALGAMREFLAHPERRSAKAWSEVLGVSCRRVQQLAQKLGKRCMQVPPGPPPGTPPRTGNGSRYW